MRRKLFSIVLSICMVFTMIPMAGGGVFAANGPNNIEVSNATYYDSGALKSIKASFTWGGASAKAELVLMTKMLQDGDGANDLYGDFTDCGNYGGKITSFEDYEEASEYNNGEFGFIAHSGLKSGYSYGSGIDFVFPENSISLAENALYYIFIWTEYNSIYYPDYIVCAISVQDGVVKYAPADGTGRNTYDENALDAITSVNKYSVTVTKGEHMTKTAGSGDEIQRELNKGMTPVVYAADEGYYFPEDYTVPTQKGIMVRRDSSTQITVYGTPSGDAEITLAAATEGVPDENTVAKPVAKTGLKYNGTEQTGVAGSSYYTLLGDKATNAGKYTATATLKEGCVWAGNTTDPAPIYWEIAEADEIKVTADNKTAYVGDAVPANSYTAEGLFETDALGGEEVYKYRLINEDGTISENQLDKPDMSKEGKYKICISGLEAPEGNNYKGIAFKEGTLTITRKQSSGGHYKPTQKPEIIAEEGSQGDLTLNGTKVTITVEEGYELVDVLVNGISKGKVTELTGLKTGDKVEIKTEKIPEKLEPQAVKDLVKELKLVARSERLSNGNVRIRVTKITDINDDPVDLNELEKNGYTVKFKYYRSVKKSAGYDTRLEKDADINSYINNFGDKGTKYYYKVKVMVYDADGNLVAQSSLNQCKYAMRTWIK